MAGIINTTARQFNLKTLVVNKGSKRRVKVPISPGFNIVEDKFWGAFASKDGKRVDPYVASLKAKGFLKFGPEQDDMELEQDPDTKAKAKSEPVIETRVNKSL